jgi:CheY-like chemotaxis protein
MGDSELIRVLVVEDNPDDQELLHYELKKTPVGKHVLAVSDPRAALKLLEDTSAPDFRRNLLAIFLDVRLPHMSGIELLKLIRQMDGMESFPVIVMTASPPPETVAACRELKVMALLEKPITFRTFTKAIANLFHSGNSPQGATS